MKLSKLTRGLSIFVASLVLATSIPSPVVTTAEEATHGNGIKAYSNKWFDDNGSWDHLYGPNAIDPTVFYGKDNKLYMVYGSWSGGLFILELHKATGNVMYPGADGREPTSKNYIDRYFGVHVAGGKHQSGEGCYIEYDKETDYYYLYETYGELGGQGGYNMRLFRSKYVYGPYLDAAGKNAADSESGNTNYGIKLIGNYQFSNQPGYRSAGHNSVLVDDDGSRYLIYHQRFEPAHAFDMHEVRVHQQFMNEDNWPVTAVYENRGEKISHYDKEDVIGDYEIINHGTSSSKNMLQTQNITLNADGSVSGNLIGTWEQKAAKDYDYISLTIGDTTYKGVLFAQQNEEETAKTVMTFSTIGNNNECIWGSAKTPYKEDSNAVTITNRVNVHDPSIVKSNDGTYYVFGSHLAHAKSTDLMHWQQNTLNNWKTDSIYGNIVENLAGSFAWAGYNDGSMAAYNSEKNEDGYAVWAPDVTWIPEYKNEDGTKGAYMIYYSTSSTWRRSCIGYAVSQNIEGPYKYVNTVIYSGFSKTGEIDGPNSTRDTKWSNDYLNLTKLIEEYKTGKPLVNEPDPDPIPTPPAPENKPTVPTPAAVGTIIKQGNASFSVTSGNASNPEVALKAPVSKSVKSFVVPTTITENGITYKVTSIGDNAFKNCKKLTKVTIGENIVTIGKQAFYNCAKLKTVTIKSKSLKKIGSSAFKKIHPKATFKVPKSKKKAYKKLFKSKVGYKKTMKIK